MNQSLDTDVPGESRALPPGLATLAEHWGLALAYGLVTLGLGITLMVWPDASVTVFTVLLAIQLIVVGVLRIVAALSDRADAFRVLTGLLGGLALIVGLLILREPLQSVLVLTMILGVFWLIAGVIDVLGALVAPGPDGRGWALFSGVLGMLFGGFLIVYTDVSLRLLVILVSIWLIVGGLLAVVVALRLRALRLQALRAPA